MLADFWWCWLFVLFVIAAFVFGWVARMVSACMLVLLLVSLSFNSVGDCLYILSMCWAFDVCDLIIMAVYGFMCCLVIVFCGLFGCWCFGAVVL